MPMDYDGMRTDDASERTDNVTDYKRTCIDFIEDISGSYLEWVDLYSNRSEITIDAVSYTHLTLPTILVV